VSMSTTSIFHVCPYKGRPGDFIYDPRHPDTRCTVQHLLNPPNPKLSLTMMSQIAFILRNDAEHDVIGSTCVIEGCHDVIERKTS